MRVSLNWLAEFIELPENNPERLSEVLISLGIEVESIERLPLEFSGVVTARVVSVRPHPQADKVRLAKVSTGEETVEVVCGAFNFEAGARVAWARPGAKIADGTEILVREIRGVKSNGMICSEVELGLGEDAAGIIVLDKETPLGIDFALLVDRPDDVLDLAITPNRGDCMSLLGIARELSAFYRVPYRLPPFEPYPSPHPITAKVKVTDFADCSRFVAGQMHNIKIASSPTIMSQRLRAAGIRPISNVVDISNYVMVELGQPLHIFDLDQLGSGQLVIRRAEPEEKLVTLDGVERELSPDDLVVADQENPVALAGIMGGLATEVTDQTSRVLIEAARWDPPLIMYRSRHHDLRSEAAGRFERGVDPEMGPFAVKRAAVLLTELAGGKLCSGWVDEYESPPEEKIVTFDINLITRLLGYTLERGEVAVLLSRLGFAIQSYLDDSELVVAVPTCRTDITRPVDLVEEVARLYGYDRLSSTVPVGPRGGWTTEQRRSHTLEQILVGSGLSGAMPLTFMDVSDLDKLAVPPEDDRRLVVAVKNPLHEDQSALRTTLIPGLMNALVHNHNHGTDSVGLYEMGRVFLDRESPTYPKLPHQPLRLGWALTGEWGSQSLDIVSQPADIYAGTALWTLIADQLHITDFELTPSSPPGYHPGRTATLSIDGKELGLIGELHPLAAQQFGLDQRVLVAELDLDSIIAPTDFWSFQPPSPYPAASFDLAFWTPDEVRAAQLVSCVQTAGGELLDSVTVFDHFTETGDQTRRTSLALKVVLRASDRTLDSEEISEVLKSIAQTAQTELGVELRGNIPIATDA